MRDYCCQCRTAIIEIDVDGEIVDGVTRESYAVLTPGARECDRGCHQTRYVSEPCFECAACVAKAKIAA